MFENLWQIVFGDGNNSTIPNRQEEKTIPDEERVIVNQADPEISLLVSKYGPLEKGLMIEISLQEILKLIPRQRKRADAYNSLAKRLKAEYEVCLRITSRKSK